MRIFLALMPLITAVSSTAPFVQGRDEAALRQRDEAFASQVSKGLRLLSFSHDDAPVWKTQAEKLALLREHTHLMDVTEVYLADQDRAAAAQRAGVVNVAKANHKYGDPSKQDEVNPLLEQLDTDKMLKNLEKLTSFFNRHLNSTTGKESAEWLQGYLRDLVADRSEITVTPFNHSFLQTSTIVHIPGKDDSAGRTIIGAHLDSISYVPEHENHTEEARAPGADDDGSGVVNLLDILRVLLENEFHPSTPVELHFYAAEEYGLLGSQDVASNYSADGIPVRAQLQFDMTAFLSKEGVIGLMTDNTDAALNDYVRKLVSTYTTKQVRNDTCGYACSDHASWNKYDYPAAFPFEAPFDDYNPRIHGPNDTIGADGWSLEHSLQFARLGLAYLYELSA